MALTLISLQRRCARPVSRAALYGWMRAGEVTELEKIQNEADSNPTIKEFAQASDELNQIKAAVVAYLDKSFEICSPPGEGDFTEETE